MRGLPPRRLRAGDMSSEEPYPDVRPHVVGCGRAERPKPAVVDREGVPLLGGIPGPQSQSNLRGHMLEASEAGGQVRQISGGPPPAVVQQGSGLLPISEISRSTERRPSRSSSWWRR
jgi:hypothetical protein